ncbi:red chlorophyll catabolite reductase [Halioglobus maricola]|uniref:Red chlorophyll catabolite reductase n=1 Tax=Halioglobus maricola TaxID=2601894 RepID=A0A5P9NLI6_9GAMM|nr:red chlorophyll catabolite reductase [Halioglobus maricola]QFU76489.1 red chlorophyll catabolite reductase [Halioglobus maricola]
MSERILTPIIDLVEASPDVDNRETFEHLWAILAEMNEKIQARFELHLDPCSERFADYSNISGSAEGAEGSLKTYTGPEVDWYVHSFIGSPESSFTNMHITLSLGPQYDVPNFGFALGTVPDLFMYMDYIPRVDLLANPEYVDRYYTAVNEEFLDLQEDARFNPFISRDLWTRVAMTPTAVGYTAGKDPAILEKVKGISLSRLDRWLKWVDEAEPTAPADRPAIAARDQLIRKTTCERDPANNLGDRLFGKEAAEAMVATLWGGARTLPRPTGE